MLYVRCANEVQKEGQINIIYQPHFYTIYTNCACRNQPACSVLKHEFGFVDLKIKLNNDHNYNINNKKKHYNNIIFSLLLLLLLKITVMIIIIIIIIIIKFYTQ